MPDPLKVRLRESPLVIILVYSSRCRIVSLPQVLRLYLVQRRAVPPAHKSRVVNGGIDPRQRAMSLERRGSRHTDTKCVASILLMFRTRDMTLSKVVTRTALAKVCCTKA